MSTLLVIEVGIDPTIELGPITLAWHGIMIAVGIVVAGLLVARPFVREVGLSVDELFNVVLVATVSGLVGAKIFYLFETGAFRDPSQWLSARGFAFNGALILAAIAIAVFLRLRQLSLRYLDVAAVAFPLGMAIGRVGDIINGEHYGPASNFVLALRHTNPEASVPDPTVAYHDGGLYESLISLMIFAVIWPLRHRLRRPLLPFFSVVGLYALGRFFAFFLRSDSETLALGLSTSQWASLAVLLVAGVGVVLTLVRAGTSKSASAAT